MDIYTIRVYNDALTDFEIEEKTALETEEKSQSEAVSQETVPEENSSKEQVEEDFTFEDDILASDDSFDICRATLSSHDYSE